MRAFLTRLNVSHVDNFLEKPSARDFLGAFG